MGVRPRSWWQKNRKLLEVFGIIVVCMLMIALLVVVVLAYVFNMNVAGLRGKTLWDWLQLAIVPVVLTIGVWWLNHLQQQRDQRLADRREKSEREISLDNQHEAA